MEHGISIRHKKLINSPTKLPNKYPNKSSDFSIIIIIIIKLHLDGVSAMKNVEGMMNEMRGEAKEKKMWEIKKYMR